MHTAHDLGQRRVFQVAQAIAVIALGQEQVPQVLSLGLLLEFFQNGRNLPPVALAVELLGICFFVGVDVIVHEAVDFLAQLGDLG